MIEFHFTFLPSNIIISIYFLMMFFVVVVVCVRLVGGGRAAIIYYYITNYLQFGWPFFFFHLSTLTKEK